MNFNLLTLLSLLLISTAATLAFVTVVSATMTINVDPSQIRSDPTPSDFASFSAEVPCVPTLFSTTDSQGHVAPRSSYVNLLTFLKNVSEGSRGPNVRIGGNSADEMWYCGDNCQSTPLPSGDTGHLPNSYIQTYSYAKLWGGSVTVDLSLRNKTDPSNAVAYAMASLKHVEDSFNLIDAFEIGNEPDLFDNGIVRPTGYNYDDYRSDFERELYALHGAGLPKNWIQGAVWADNKWFSNLFDYVTEFSDRSSDKNNALKTFSQHHYPMSSASATIDKLLAPQASNMSSFSSYAAFSKKAGVKYLIGEGNSAYDGGKAGVSDTFTATIWSLDTLFNALSSGVRRWNFHGCTGGPYTPIALQNNVAVPRPLYYGMWAFTFATRRGASLIDSQTVSKDYANITTHAVITDTDIRFIGIHKDIDPSSPSVGLHFQLPSSAKNFIKTNATGRVYTLKVSSSVVPDNSQPLDKFKATSGVEFGGMTFDGSTDGTPSNGPAKYESINFDSNLNQCHYEIQPATAIVIEFERQQ